MKAIINQKRKYMKNNTILKTDLIPLKNGNEVIENSNIESSFQIINNLLNQDTDNKNQSLSIRGSLLIECTKLSLNEELNIHRCNVDNANTKTISKVEIESDFVKEMLNLLDEYENIRRKQRIIEGKIKYLKNNN